VAGGDTVSALAAGCPVVAKAHPAHPQLSARLAEDAGCSARTVQLIREEPSAADRRYGELLRLADEAN
jgi:NADP-dependent aldehyde dehydrogenase